MLTPRRMRVRELAEADRGGVAVAGDAEIDQIAVGEVGAGEHRRHAPVHRVEAVRVAEEIGRRLRRAADAGKFGDAVRLDRELEAGLDDRRRDRIVAAAGAQRRHRPLVIAVSEAERVLRQGGVVEFRFDDVGHVIEYTRCCRETPASRTDRNSVIHSIAEGHPRVMREPRGCAIDTDDGVRYGAASGNRAGAPIL